MNESLGSLSATAGAAPLPFDSARLDDLLDEAGMDAAVISSKHNIQYLFGGYRFFFFDHFDAIGVSRYLPLLVYVKGRPEQSIYIGHGMESYERDLGQVLDPRLPDGGSDARRHAARDRSSRKARPECEARRNRARLPARRRGGAHGARAARGHVPRSAFSVRTAAGAQDPGGAGSAADRLRPRGRFDAGGDRLARAGRDQARACRSAAPRRGEPGPHFRILPSHRRDEPQPRAFGQSVGRGRHPVARFRRQLQRLYRRPLPHGDPGRARRRARGPARRGGRHPDGGAQADPVRTPTAAISTRAQAKS